MSQRLIIEDDEGTTTIVPLGKDAVTIGRQQGNTIQLTEKNVSRRHARLYPEQAVWVIEDLGSYNGVKVNGVPIDARVNLKEGDVVQIGDYHLALTEDVDKRTLNYSTAGAANDGAMPEPMLASSSTDLPRLSAEELAALQSGPQPISTPALLDSGPVPATPVPVGYEERKKGGAGVLIGFGVVVALALVGGIAWMATDSGGDGDETHVVTAGKVKEATPAAKTKDNGAQPPPETKAADTPPPVPPEAAGDDAAAADGGAAPTPPPEPDTGEPEVVVEETPTPTPPPTPPPEPARPRNGNKKRGGGKGPKKDTTPSPPPKPPQPAADPGVLIADARKIGLKSPSKGYELARQALKAGGGRAAAKLMATMACRIPDAGKAKKALNRLKGADREAVAKICRAKNIDV